MGHIPLRSDLFVYSIKAVQTATFSTSDNVQCDPDDKEKSGSMDAKALAQSKLCVGQVTSVGK